MKIKFKYYKYLIQTHWISFNLFSELYEKKYILSIKYKNLQWRSCYIFFQKIIRFIFIRNLIAKNQSENNLRLTMTLYVSLGVV